MAALEGSRPAQPTRVEVARAASDGLHTALVGTLPGFVGLVTEGDQTFVLMTGSVDPAVVVNAVAKAVIAVPAAPPTSLGASSTVALTPDYVAQYAAATTDSERIAVLARKAGLA